MTIPGEAWKDRGNCATEDGKYLVYFMPDFSGYYTRRGESKERAIAKATAMCKAGCPVIDECEAYRGTIGLCGAYGPDDTTHLREELNPEVGQTGMSHLPLEQRTDMMESDRPREFHELEAHSHRIRSGLGRVGHAGLAVSR